jgi:hypothetical protein
MINNHLPIFVEDKFMAKIVFERIEERFSAKIISKENKSLLIIYSIAF